VRYKCPKGGRDLSMVWVAGSGHIGDTGPSHLVNLSDYTSFTLCGEAGA
jgi:hypothetical protein